MSHDCDEFLFRQMTPDDVDRVMALARILPEAPDWPRSVYVSATEAGGAHGRAAFVAVEPGAGTIAGYVIASLVPPEAELEVIAVAPEAQCRGIASCLLAVLAARLRIGNVTEVMLEVRASNEPALRLYRSAGFAETGRRLHYYADPVEDAVLMRLKLN